jgi:hypothetical protein
MRELRRVILEYFTRRSDANWDNVRRDVGKVARERGLVAGGTLTEPVVDRILWDLIVERLLSLGSSNGQAEARYPFLYITEMGKAIASGQEHLYDPDEHVASLKRRVPTLDSVVSQYLLEAVGSFQRGLLFGAAVLCGAAAEREILLLLTAIEKWDPDPNRKTQAQSLLQRPRLPSIFLLVDGAIQDAIANHGMPYTVHQGSSTHLLSLQEMVRVQRNEAVHPAAASVSRDKVFLSLQSFPGAIEVTERLRIWFP